jgi:hypothetical protein
MGFAGRREDDYGLYSVPASSSADIESVSDTFFLGGKM